MFVSRWASRISSVVVGISWVCGVRRLGRPGSSSGGLAWLVEGPVEGAVTEPTAAAEDEAAGVVRAGPWPGWWAVTIFALGGHRLFSVVGGWPMRGRWRWR